MPLWLQTQLGYTATWAGLVSAPTGMVAVLLTPVAAGLMARTDARLVASISFAAAAASYFLRAGLTNDASFIAIAIPLMVQGIASASFLIALVIIVLDGLPQARIPDASGLANFARILSSGFAASLVTTLWDNREALHQSRLAESATLYAPPFNAALAALRHMGLEGMAATARMTRAMVGQAYLLASLDIFALSAWLCVGLIGLVWLCRKPASGAAMPAID
jgi:DHA2 family multidrug resistance protein